MDSLKIPKIFLLLFCTVVSHTLIGQTVGGGHGYVPTFTTYQQQMDGKTKSGYFQIDVNGIQYAMNIPNWRIAVRAMGNYTNTSNPNATIAPHFTGFQFNNVNKNGMAPANTSPVFLQTSETTIISGTPALNPSFSGYYLSYKFDYIIQGGNHMLVANGDYRVSLEFLLYDGNNNLLDTFVMNDVGFQIQGGNYGTNGLMLQNSADVVNLQFDSVSDYYSGISVSKPLGLKVEYQVANEIIVKTSSAQLTSLTTSNTIPVSLFKIELTQTQQSLPNLVLSPPTSLSTSEVLVAQNPHTDYTYTDVEYDLHYSVPSSDAAAVFGYAATYTTSVIFIVLPQ